VGPRTTAAAYDAHADWYNDFMSAAAGEYIRRVHATIADLLGRGEGTCLDVCCGTGAHAPALAVDERYADRSRSFDTWNPAAVRARVGAWHIPLADLLNATTAAGLRLIRTAEAGPGGVPDLFGYLSVKI
jgi:SAM-dependent methyltransferase